MSIIYGTVSIHWYHVCENVKSEAKESSIELIVEVVMLNKWIITFNMGEPFPKPGTIACYIYMYKMHR